MDSIISISGLAKTYASGFAALKGVDLDIRRGEIFALLGPNGAGKTTLISVVCGLVNASAGSVRVDGHDIGRDYRAARALIGLVPFDVDGVLTDGTVHVSPTGEMLREMHIRDGFAMKAAVESGYNVCIISGGSNEGVRIRLRNLGITDIHLATPDKVATFKEYCDIYTINPENVLYMGDDIPDYHVMQLVGLPTCPQNAVPEIKGISKYISHVEGGKGAVRDVIEQVMKVQGKWMEHFDAKFD